jgi:hypothetical protein
MRTSTKGRVRTGDPLVEQVAVTAKTGMMQDAVKALNTDMGRYWPQYQWSVSYFKGVKRLDLRPVGPRSLTRQLHRLRRFYSLRPSERRAWQREWRVPRGNQEREGNIGRSVSMGAGKFMNLSSTRR